MNFLSRLGAFGFLLILCTAFTWSPFTGNLKKGFAALDEYNYFEAKKRFQKAFKRDSVAAGYGLSIIFGRKDNPFHQLDSAKKYVYIAVELYPGLEEKIKEKYDKLGVDSLSVTAQLTYVDSSFFELVQNENSLPVWEEYIKSHKTLKFINSAIEHRNALAYSLAVDTNTSNAYKNFINKYPNAPQVNDAEKKYQFRLYQEETQHGKIRDYQRFLEMYPGSPYASDAQYKVYERSTAPGTIEVYKQFIEENPVNENVSLAWRNIYTLEIRELNAKSIAAFSLKYPDYPFAEELKMDFKYVTTPYYPIEQDQLWGFINDKGELRIEPQYEWVEDFNENMAVVGKNDKVGFITKSGELIGEIEFDDTYGFKNGYAVVVKNDLYGAINRMGKWVVPAVYEDLGEFSDGYFYAQTDKGYGYLDQNGNVVIDFVFDNATDFKNGLAVVQKDGKYGVVNTKGLLVINFEYDWIQPFLSNREPTKFKNGDKFGLIDQAGLVIVDSVYTYIGDFSEGLAIAANENNKYGFIDANADTAVDFRFNFTSDVLRYSKFENGWVRIFQNQKMGAIDTLGNRIFPAMFEDLGELNGKLIPVMKTTKWGYADLNVSLAIPYKYDYAGNFRGNTAVVSLDGLFGVIDTSGNKVIDFKYKTLQMVDTLALVSDSAYGLIDLRGDILVPLVYDEAAVIDYKMILFKNTERNEQCYFDFKKKEFIWRSKLE